MYRAKDMMMDSMEKLDSGYTEEQMQTIHIALTNKISKITGGPGTGKSLVIGGLVQVLRSYDLTPTLTAYTARVAHRLREVCGHCASTIHTLLGWNGSEFPSPEERQLDTNFIIVNETSMVNLHLLKELLIAAPSNCHVLFVGDVDQLPPIGAGAPFRDMISSGRIAVTRLNFNHRQNENQIAKYTSTQGSRE
jgi:exodeoxyribonuclease V alpha subunit